MEGFYLGKESLIKSLKSIFEKDSNRKLSEKEEILLDHELDSILDSTKEVTDYVENDEILLIKQQTLIEDVSAAIRMVVVCYTDLSNNPFPYDIKKNIPLIKEAHTIVLKHCSSTIFQQIIEFARNDIFTGWSKLKGDTTDYCSFFNEYTNNPKLFNLHKIEELTPEKYKSQIDKELFEL